MTKRIFHSMIWISFLVFTAGFVLITVLLYQDFENRLEDELKREAGYLAEGIRYEGISYLEAVSDQSERITFVDGDGNVLYDNQADETTMENHKDREEIKEALESGQGEAVRESSTLSQKTIYYALRLSDGTVLRLSSTQSTVFALLSSLLLPLLLILAVMIVVVALVSGRVAKKIVAPLNQLDLEHPDQNDAYEEITPLLRKLLKQQKTIERQLMEAKRQQQEFVVITDNMKEGLLVMDSRGEILSCNGSAMKMFHTDCAVKNQSILSLNRSAEFQKITDGVLAGNHEDTVINLDSRSVRMIANPVFSGDHVEGAVLLMVDVTEKIQREELRREFTANVSHELKTPLTSISGFAELLKNGLVKQEDVSKFGGRIFDEAQRLITLVNDIMEISQLDEGTLPYEKEKVDLYELGAEILNRLEPEAKKEEVALSIEGEKTVLNTVRKVLDEVIYNLCDNAIKYNQKGGRVVVAVGTKNGKKFVSVKDTGIGIPAEHQSRIFERFYRVDKSHSRKIGGTGLGLSIVKHGALCLGAEITLISEVGKGSEFILVWGD